jgi:PAS domain S-box-containing protein
MKKLSLRWQILLLVVSAVTIVFGALVVLTIDQIETQLKASLLNKATSISSVIAANVGPGLEFQDTAYVAEIMEAAFADTDVHGVSVYDKDDREIYRRMIDSLLIDFKDTCNQVEKVQIARQGELIFIECPVYSRDQLVGCLWLVVSEQVMRAQVYEVITITLAGGAILFLLTVIVGAFVARRVVKPIQTFEEAATRISSGDMKSTIHLDMLHRDFVPLGTAFNNMQEVLAGAFQQLQQSRDGLETQVAERTSELNEELHVRSKAEEERRARLVRIQQQRTAITRLTTDEIVTGGDFDQAARTMTEIVAQAMGVDRVSIWFMNEEQSQIECTDLYEHSQNSHSGGTVLKASDFPAYFEAIQNERLLAADDAQTDPRTCEFKDGYLTPLKITSMLDTAIRVSGTLLGVVCFEHVGSKRVWLSDEISFADEIAGHIAQVYANAERRLTGIALKEGQELLKATLESTADGILVVNHEGKATHANALFSEMWRIPGEVMASQNTSEFQDCVLGQLSDPDAFLDKVTEMHGSTEESLDLLTFKDGRVFERFSCPLVQNNVVAGRVWSFRDITERVKAEEGLRESQQKLLLHVQQTPLGVIEWDLDFKVREWNQAAEKIFGYSRKEAIGRHAAGLIVPDHARELVDQIWAGLLANRGGTRSTNDNTTKSGRVLTCEWYNTPLVDDAGKAIGVASLVLDVTEQTRSQKTRAVLLKISEAAHQTESPEELLATVRAELGTIIDTENFYVALYDPESDLYSFPYHRDKLNIENMPEPEALRGSLTDYVRRTGESLLVDEKVHLELKGRGEAEMVGPPSAVWLGIPLRTSAGTIGVMVVQDYDDPSAFTQSDADWLTSVAEPIARVIERSRAIHQEYELREQLERAERMESLGVMAGGVAHDLNNMLGPLVGYPELMLMKLAEDNPMRKQVQRISNSARGAADVVQDLLTLARRGRYEMIPTNINEIVEAYLDSPSFDQLQQKHPKIKANIRLEEKLGRFQGSSPHLSKVVMNLIINAFDAMLDGGELTITTSRGYYKSLLGGYDDITPGEFILLRIRDTGVGIDAKDIDKIFEPYYSKKEMGSSGSGLGLSVVYGVIKDHKGYYDILSKPGEGAEFVLYFPVTRAAAKTAAGVTADLSGTESILVIDDDKPQREMSIDLIGSMGYQVATVASGREAVEYLKDNSVDLLLLDMIMEPDFDGLDTYREIVKQHPDQKAIIVSGYSSTDRMSETQKLGAGALVKKPYSRQAVGLAIRHELDRPRDAVATDQTAPTPA